MGRGILVSVDQMTLSIVKMLNGRYDEEHNVTTQRVFEIYLSKAFLRRMDRSFSMARMIANNLKNLGIIEPYEHNPTRVSSVWRINIPSLKEYLEKRGELSLPDDNGDDNSDENVAKKDS